VTASAGQLLRVGVGLILPLLLALPVCWHLRTGNAALRETRTMIQADLVAHAPGVALGNENNRLRALTFARKAVVDAIESDRMGSLQWLDALGTLPEGIVLTRAALHGANWEIAGFGAPGTSMETLTAQFKGAGLMSEEIEPRDATRPGREFLLRGRRDGVGEGAGGS
jgi:hypothetical protein